MYFVDRQKISQTLAYMDDMLALFEKETNWQSRVEQLALERLAQNIIESVIDVGNQMIDGFIMRDPGSYEDVIDILVDEKVIPKDQGGGFKTVIQLRKPLVQRYMLIDHQKLRETLAKHILPLKQFSKHVAGYLEQELGPVSAFSPDKTEND